MTSQASRFTLRNGVEVYGPSNTSFRALQSLYNEMSIYFKHGIEIHPDDVIFDVGANVGTFAVYVNKILNKAVDLHSFEPIPDVFEVLKLNSTHFCSERTIPHAFGLAEETKTVTFFYFPDISIWSSMYPRYDEMMESKLMKAWFSRLAAPTKEILLKNLQTPVELSCQVKRLSEVMHDHDLQRIDLLKLDVEKSELGVLLGIDDQDWPKIKQIVGEVHDFEDNLPRMKALLETHGFSNILFHQDRAVKGTDVLFLYASR